jgi:hypothetical protein
MEVSWKRGWNPNAPSHCRGMILGNNTKNSKRKIPEGRTDHCSIQTFPGQRNRDLKNPNSSLRNNSRNGGN